MEMKKKPNQLSNTGICTCVYLDMETFFLIKPTDITIWRKTEAWGNVFPF